MIGTYIITACVSILFIMALSLCVCWRKKTPKDEWHGLDGMVKQKNPDENVNHLPSASAVSCDVDDLHASGENLDSNKRGTITNTKRSLPDIPSEQGTAVNWEPNGDNSSEHYATVGQYQNAAKRQTLSNGINTRPSISQHSSMSQADDTFSPYERVKYDKINPKEHPYAQLQPNTSRTVVYEEGQVEERVNLLRAETTATINEPTAQSRSRRSSAHSNPGANNTLDIPAASAVAGGVAASPELPYMTPPVTQSNFSGDSQDSTKGYTSISVREPLADILAQTKEMSKKKRELDPHYSTVSDDSDDVYTTIPDSNNQIYNSESETYARIPPLPITVEVEVNPPPASPSPAPVCEAEADDQLYEPPPHTSISNTPIVETNRPSSTHSHSRQASTSSSVTGIGSPKPEKRQANSPLPPPPPNTSTTFDFHNEKPQVVRNLDDLYAKVHKNKREDRYTEDGKSGSAGESARSSVGSTKSSAFEETKSHNDVSNTKDKDHNYESLKKSQRKPSDPGYEKIKARDDVCYASINGPESFVSHSDPGYEVLKSGNAPSDIDPNYEQLRHKNSNLSDYGYSRVKEQVIDGYSVVNKRKNRLDVGPTFSSDTDTTDPNYESVPSEVNDPPYNIVKENINIDPNYESVGHTTEVIHQNDPSYESLSLTDPNYEYVKDLEPPYERFDEESSRANLNISGYEKIQDKSCNTSDSSGSNGKSDTDPLYEQLNSETDGSGYEKIHNKSNESFNNSNTVHEDNSDGSGNINNNNNNSKTQHVVVNETTLNTYIHEEDVIFQV